MRAAPCRQSRAWTAACSSKRNGKRGTPCRTARWWRLYRLGIQLSHGQVLQLGRQIRESLDRERTWGKASRVEQPLARTAAMMGAVPNALATKISAECMTVPLAAIIAAPEPACRHRVRKLPGHTERALRLSQQQQATIGGLITAVKINCEFLAADGWKVEGKHKPLLRRMLPTHSSTHAVRPIAQPEDTRAAFGCLRRALDTSRLPSC
jgi:hypothetical protein